MSTNNVHFIDEIRDTVRGRQRRRKEDKLADRNAAQEVGEDMKEARLRERQLNKGGAERQREAVEY